MTSWSLLLAAAWPSTVTERVVLEADADGGVLAARYGLGVEPGVAGLVAAARRHDAQARWVDLADVARRLSEHVWVVPGPESAERTVPVWGTSADEVAAMSARDDRIWLVDCGRLSRQPLAAPFVARAELAIVMCGSAMEDLVPVPQRVASLQRTGAAAAGVIVVGRSAYGLDELRDFFGTALVWTVRAAQDLPHLANLALSSRRARRTWAWRETLSVAGSIADRLGIADDLQPEPEPEPAPEPDAPIGTVG